MSSVNKVIIIGRLGKDPEVRMAGDGKAIANLNLATSERWTDKRTGEKKEQTEWHRVVAYSPQSEVIEKYAYKGSQIYIEGKLQTRKWTDKDNIERYTTEIVVSSLTLLDKKDTDKSAVPAKTPVSAEPAFDEECPF